MIKCILAWAFCLLLALAFAGTALFWPLFADWAVANTGWTRADLMEGGRKSALNSTLFAIGMTLGFSVVASAVLTVFVHEYRTDAEQKRLRERDALCDKLETELAQSKRDYEAQKATLDAALRERDQALAANKMPISVTAFGAGGPINGLVREVKPKEPTLSDQALKQLSPVIDAIVKAAQKAEPHEPAAVSAGGSVPYRIKAQPLKISDLRVGDEVVYLGDKSPAGLSTVLVGKVQEESAFGCDEVVIGGKRVWHSEILGTVRRIGA